MGSPNGDRRLAKAISFLINRINSAMFNYNDSDKNARWEVDVTITAQEKPGRSVIFVIWGMDDKAGRGRPRPLPPRIRGGY